jgi:hypothetical protein
MSMTLRTNLANVQTSTWTGPSCHSFISWARITQMRSYFLSMGSTSYANTFFTSTLLISKPKRRKKRFKEDTQATNQEIIIKFFINKWKLKFKILCTNKKYEMLIINQNIIQQARNFLFNTFCLKNCSFRSCQCINQLIEPFCYLHKK